MTGAIWPREFSTIRRMTMNAARWPLAGRQAYHAMFGTARVLKFMVETLLGESYSESYEWANQVYR